MIRLYPPVRLRRISAFIRVEGARDLWEVVAMAMSRARQHVLQQLRAPSDDLIDQMFSRSNPNPARVGCPSRHVLVELAGRVRPIGDVRATTTSGVGRRAGWNCGAIQRSMMVESSLVH